MIRTLLLCFSISSLLCLSACATTSPIAQPTGNTLTLTPPHSFERQPAWNTIERNIRGTSAQNVILLWSGLGGYVDQGEHFISAMRYSGKSITIRVVGGSLSMHANVACSATYMDFHSGYLMFHTPDSHGVVARNSGSLFNACISRGILTRADAYKIDQGYELYVYPSGSKKFIPDPRRH